MGQQITCYDHCCHSGCQESIGFGEHCHETDNPGDAGSTSEDDSAPSHLLVDSLPVFSDPSPLLVGSLPALPHRCEATPQKSGDGRRLCVDTPVKVEPDVCRRRSAAPLPEMNGGEPIVRGMARRSRSCPAARAMQRPPHLISNSEVHASHGNRLVAFTRDSEQHEKGALIHKRWQCCLLSGMVIAEGEVTAGLSVGRVAQAVAHATNLDDQPWLYCSMSAECSETPLSAEDQVSALQTNSEDVVSLVAVFCRKPHPPGPRIGFENIFKDGMWHERARQ
eukprot:TRINITY_DN26770_c0_g1_i1.p1 TRINITY_DN26770_c0_g1~~TRINITY_DN26770_c0_g1_i1.p1  ORF type:complete len:293 (+),score=35.84 TRINITY_DN26770_c0_g1_i1:43-879(+)